MDADGKRMHLHADECRIVVVMRALVEMDSLLVRASVVL